MKKVKIWIGKKNMKRKEEDHREDLNYEKDIMRKMIRDDRPKEEYKGHMRGMLSEGFKEKKNDDKISDDVIQIGFGGRTPGNELSRIEERMDLGRGIVHENDYTPKHNVHRVHLPNSKQIAFDEMVKIVDMSGANRGLFTGDILKGEMYATPKMGLRNAIYQNPILMQPYSGQFGVGNLGARGPGVNAQSQEYAPALPTGNINPKQKVKKEKPVYSSYKDIPPEVLKKS